MKDSPEISQLKSLATQYNATRADFIARIQELKEPLSLSIDQQSQVDYGILEPADPALQKNCDFINRDEQAGKLSQRMHSLFLDGSLIIIKKLQELQITFRRHNLQKYIQQPDKYYHEIEMFIQSLYGYRHIYSKRGELYRMSSLRSNLKTYPEILSLVDVWVRELNMFDERFSEDAFSR
ncbi:MAG: hypothetical protein HC905_07215 [Bacteroidales bacterium]|nr:hypothetical protein [Bacteroidales bacterium]